MLHMATSDRLDRIDALLEKLTEREEYYEAFLDANPWGILVVDESYRIVYMNKTMEELCGYEIQDIDGEHLHILIPRDTREIHKKHEEEYVLNPRVRLGDHPFRPQILNSRGELVDVEISLAPAQVKGETYFFASLRRRETLPSEVVNDAS